MPSPESETRSNSMAYADNKPRTVFAAGPQFHIALTGAVYAGDLIGDSSGWVQADAAWSNCRRICAAGFGP